MTRISSSVVCSALRGLVKCAVCQKPVMSINVDISPMDDLEFTAVFRCHEKSEMTRFRVNPYNITLTPWPRVAFLRNWASYGVVSAAARQERREHARWSTPMGAYPLKSGDPR